MGTNESCKASFFEHRNALIVLIQLVGTLTFAASKYFSTVIKFENIADLPYGFQGLKQSDVAEVEGVVGMVDHDHVADLKEKQDEAAAVPRPPGQEGQVAALLT